MLRITVLAAALAAALGSPALAQSFVGHWTATASSQAGDSTETLTVTKTGNGYSITSIPATPPPAGVVVSDGENIVLNGDDFSYDRKIGSGQTAITISYKGVVSGDTFTGTAALGGVEVPYAGVRVAAGK